MFLALAGTAMSASPEVFRRALDAAFALSEIDPPWTEILRGTRDLFGGDSATFLHAEGDRLLELRQMDIEQAAEREYVEHFASQDILLSPASSRRSGTWLDTETLMSRKARDSNAYYCDFMCKHGMRQMRSLVIDKSPSIKIGLSIQNEFAVDDARFVSSAQKEAFTQVFLAGLQRRKETVRNWFASAEKAFSAFGEAMCLVDAQGCIVQSSPEAQALLDMPYSLHIRHGRLWHPLSDIRTQLLDAFAKSDNGGRHSRVLIPATTGSPNRAVVADIVRADERRSMRNRPLLMVRIGFREKPDLAMPAISARYGITPAEGRVLLALSQGQTAATISRQANVSLHTVRKQIAILMEKTGCSRQLDLVLLVLG
ncbi:helix-turn-helix transcriptional regulator [Variovorax sp. RHLX14]|uniref:helix-turn-helix transcriptional regulator n=1 Tax=Variovorax sp. RHLX14 TaxID=1259731 RepID=UPI003F4625E4